MGDTTARIAAPPQKVFDQLTQPADQLEPGPLKVGDTFYMQQPNQVAISYVVTVLQAPNRFAYTLTAADNSYSVAFDYTILPDGDGSLCSSRMRAWFRHVTDIWNDYRCVQGGRHGEGGAGKAEGHLRGASNTVHWTGGATGENADELVRGHSNEIGRARQEATEWGGDYQNTNQQHHGLPNERAAAWALGFNNYSIGHLQRVQRAQRVALER
ncbi:MAG: SRPBCC family protein [Chloroflexota bacterium]